MIVEDESVVAVGVRGMVQDSGHEVVMVARSGEEAIATADEAQPDVAIVDVKLPGIDGIETTRRLTESGRTAVIILTAYADDEFVEGAASAGACAYLLKPVTKEELSANLQVAVARASELAELRKEANDVKAALEVRKLSERAKHVLMERLSLSESEAFDHLRQKCRNQNKTMRQVSEDILVAEEVFMSSIDKSPPSKRRPLSFEPVAARDGAETAEV
mgnify:CR=1 FL=1